MLRICLKMNSFVVGVTIVALGTSMPELAAAIVSVFDGSPQIVSGVVLELENEGERRPLGVCQRRIERKGSGVVLDRQGHILTNHHVVEGAREVRVTLFDGKSYAAASVGGDEIDAGTYFCTIEEVSRHDASIGWNLFVANSKYNWQISKRTIKNCSILSCPNISDPDSVTFFNNLFLITTDKC